MRDGANSAPQVEALLGLSAHMRYEAWAERIWVFGTFTAKLDELKCALLSNIEWRRRLIPST